MKLGILQGEPNQNRARRGRPGDHEVADGVDPLLQRRARVRGERNRLPGGSTVAENHRKPQRLRLNRRVRVSLKGLVHLRPRRRRFDFTSGRCLHERFHCLPLRRRIVQLSEKGHASRQVRALTDRDKPAKGARHDLVGHERIAAGVLPKPFEQFISLRYHVRLIRQPDQEGNVRVSGILPVQHEMMQQADCLRGNQALRGACNLGTDLRRCLRMRQIGQKLNGPRRRQALFSEKPDRPGAQPRARVVHQLLCHVLIEAADAR